MEPFQADVPITSSDWDKRRTICDTMVLGVATNQGTSTATSILTALASERSALEGMGERI